jgi:hypothetical protein
MMNHWPNRTDKTQSRLLRFAIYILGLIYLSLVLAGCNTGGELTAATPTMAVAEPPAAEEAAALPAEMATPEAETAAVGDGTTAGNDPAGPPPLQPYPYTTPLPPPTPTLLDGVYIRPIPVTNAPILCKRCAPYRLEGGDWLLHLDRGAFRVSHPETGFQGVGSFTVDADRLFLFNDPNCPQDVADYRWRLDGNTLILEADEDSCGFGLRIKNLTYGGWERRDPCQPPNEEAAVTGHWPIPAECNE